MSGSLAERNALVTGGSRGIGRAVAVELARRGADVVLIDRTGRDDGPAVLEIREMGRRCFHVACDVSKAEPVLEAASKVHEEVGPIHILVNNAGITRDQLLVRMSDEDWDGVLATNLKGAFLCTRTFVKDMMKARWGRIVNISSVVGTQGNAGQANYAAAKSGLVGMSRSVAKELASRGVTVNVVAPGYIQTAMTEGFDEKTQESLLSAIPMSRLGEPDDVAGIVGFLCTKEASYITGQVIHVDGGMAMS